MRCTVRVSLLAPGMPGDTSTPPPRLSLVGVPSVQKVARYRPASKSLPVAACPVGLPPPWDPGESHVGFCKSLLTKGKWILKVASDSEGAADERIWRVLCRPARPARGECAARFDRDFVHRVAGDAVRSDELHRHGAVCAEEGVSLARCAGAQEWLAKPRHIQP